MQLIRANIVIIASAHNPSILSPQWLQDNDLILEKPIKFIHTSDFSLFESETFSLIIDTQRLQIITKKMDIESLNAIKKIGNGYIKLLSHIPYKGLGLNFVWTTEKNKEGQIPEISIKIGSVDNLSPILPNHELKYGCIIHAKKDPYLLKFTITPQVEDILTYTFNYHHDISDLDVSKIKEYIDNFTDLHVDSQNVIKNLA